MSGAVIFALDGVLANDEHRQPADGMEVPWRQRYAAHLIEKDRPILNMVRLCKQLSVANDIVIVSERPIAVSEITRQWISWQGIAFDAIYMKQDLKEQSPAVVKYAMIQECRTLGWKPWLVVDCDPEIIRRLKGVSGMHGLLV